jgi:hypothetical protein
MNKKSILFYSIIVLGSFSLINSCKKEFPEKNVSKISSGPSTRGKTTNVDAYLNSVLDDESIDCIEKTNQLIGHGELSLPICNKLLSKMGEFSPYELEVIFGSQIDLPDQIISKLIESPLISDATLKTILISNTPLSTGNISKVQANRSSILISEINGFNNLEKFICLCDNVMIFGTNVIEVKECNSVTYIIENSFTRTLANGSGDNSARIAAGCGDGWTCGKLTSSSTTYPDGLTVTIVNCSRPPEDKCAKRLKKSHDLSPQDQGSLNQLRNSNSSDFVNGKHILNLEIISESLMSEIIEMKCDLNPFVFETILLTAGKLSDNNLIKLINQKEQLSDAFITNVLIVNTPLTERVRGEIANIRPDLNLSYVGTFNTKDVVFSFCYKSLIYGDDLTLTDVSNGTKLEFTNGGEIPMINTADSEEIGDLTTGCGSHYICGELHTVSGNTTTTIYTCATPPNDHKCLKVAKKK